MKTFLKLFLLCLFPAAALAQKDPTWGYVNAQQADSLKRSVLSESNDTLKMAAFRSLGFYYQDFIADSGLYFHEKQLALSKKLKMNLWQADAFSQAGYCLETLSDFMKAYEYFSEAMKLANDEKNNPDNWHPWAFSNAENGHDARIAILAMNYQMMGNLWGDLGEKEKQRAYYEEAVKLGKSINNGKIIYIGYSGIANGLQPDSVIILTNKGLGYAAAAGFRRTGNSLLRLAKAYADKGNWDSAFVFANKSIATNQADNYLRSLVTSYYGASLLFGKKDKKDSSIVYANKALAAARITRLPASLQMAYESVAAASQLNNKRDSAFYYEQLSNKLNDSLKNARISSLINYQKFAFNEQLRLKKQEEQQTAYVNKLKMTGLVAMMVGILVVAIILYRNNRQKQKANKVLETTLADLKSTQSQLIQSEKMASLGELTAGIAHEIQNPLNFVNNFSEVNSELIEEMKAELSKGNIDEAKTIANDIDDNEQKIIFHGKRADTIVKGMLQHSRSSNGQKELTDINALADEYLRLAYHGLRAKDSAFNATLKTDLDPSIGSIKIVSQDIGRVILNLINNAFYAVNEKKKDSPQPLKGSEDYEPVITISTQAVKPPSGGLGAVSITVSDNGNGISPHLLDKIFQPFFTTKPTGQGTGLGLSLSYDIVKAHGGELKVESKQGEGTSFTVRLPYP